MNEELTLAPLGRFGIGDKCRARGGWEEVGVIFRLSREKGAGGPEMLRVGRFPVLFLIIFSHLLSSCGSLGPEKPGEPKLQPQQSDAR